MGIFFWIPALCCQIYYPPSLQIIVCIIILLTFILANLQVNNTDAEGRLTLADALVYTCKQGVDKVYIHKLIFDNLFVYLVKKPYISFKKIFVKVLASLCAP